MQKTFIIITALFLSSISMMAQSVREAWLTMPESLMPYLTEPMRSKLTTLMEQREKTDSTLAIVQNSLNTQTVMRHLSETRLDVSTDSVIDMTIARLPHGTDSVFCVIKTLRAPEPVSFVSIYNKVWKKIEDISFDNMELTQRPDTLSESEYNELIKLIEPKMIKAELLSDERTLILDLSMPLTSKEEKERLLAIFLQRKAKWNGKSFK